MLGSLALVGAAGYMSAALADPPRPLLDCRLEVGPQRIAGGPVEVQLTLQNPTERTLHVLAWNTPLEEVWLGSPFELRGPGGDEVEYRGPMVKRGDPEGDDYVSLPAKAEVSATADLSAVYDLSRAGTYELRWVGALHDVTGASVPRPRSRHQPLDLDCAAVRFELSPR